MGRYGAMTNVGITPPEIVAGIAVLIVLFVCWRASVRRARAVADGARAGARVLSLAGRVLFTAALIVGVQWIVIVYASSNKWLLLGVLGLPALFASHTLTRALTVTTMDTPRRRGGRR
jgi:cytochrome b561